VHATDASAGANMDCTKHELDRRSVGTRRQADDTQDAGELKRFQEDVLRAIAPLQDKMSPEAGVVSSWPALLHRGGHDVPAMMSIRQYPISLPLSFKQKLFVFGAMIAIVVGVSIGVMIVAADTGRVTLADSSVTRWLTQLTGGSPDAVKNDGAPIILNDTTAQAEPAPPSSQIPITEAPDRAVPDHPTSPQTTSSSPGSVQSADLTQPAAATSDYGQGGSSGKDETASSAINEGAPVAASANVSSSSVAVPVQRDTELYREFIEWQANREKPQVQQHRSARSFKRAAGTLAPRTHRDNAANVTGNRSSLSSRAKVSIPRQSRGL